MRRRVLVTGSEGCLGRALRAAFEAEGDEVVGLDKPGSAADIEFDLDGSLPWCDPSGPWDVVVCNAKTWKWESHHALAVQATSAIVNISSIYGVVGNDPEMYIGTEVDPTPAWYAASKAALIGLTKWQAANLAPVRANCVCPGGILRGHSDAFRERYSSKVPLGRMATEADIVPPVLFLADDVRAAYITGQVIAVDGGLTSRA